ncbi:penicillin-binding protein [Gracilibacillus ureilyticus]|uniref:Penicillin-binding protein n=1 Tax=Gracilibacillus ureilyticus TaxID=531814 RepID=A0A1H9TCC4_9BACI|nr:transglycosylase domain-containing protein [Gracilibacillus ureilyticus]SER94811.1 penicillin-binding protein [Gracilibacillus ureilyticus]
MKIKEFLQKCREFIHTAWKKQTIQKTSRIGYHIIWNITLLFITIGIIGVFFVGGLGAGYFASLVDDEQIQTKDEMTSAIYNYEETSEFYFANNQFLSEVSTDLLRDETSLDQVSNYVQNAVIATEDEYFETHNGIVPKAILRAVFQEVTNSATKTGGSTLTQQIIKNQILTNEVSFERKAKEILLAMRLEQFFEKDEILEAYLNIVPFGRNSSGQNIAGVQTAAQGIFGVNASDLNLAQSAYIAGLPQSPSYYTPFLNGGGLKDEEGLQPGVERMNSVLSRMLEAGYITETEYNEALNYDIVADFKSPEESVLEEYPYLVNELKKRATDILVESLAEKDGYTLEDLENSSILLEEYEIRAERELASSGLRIHSTIDKELYDVFQKVSKEYSNYGVEKPARNERNNTPIMVVDPETGQEVPLGNQPVQVGSVLIENSTGKILSFVGGRDFSVSQKNHATDVRRPNGSTMKPLVAYAPAMDLGVVQPGSVVADVATSFRGYNKPPNNYVPGRYYGLVSVREALYKSHNISALQVYSKIIDQNPVEKYLEKMGFEALSHEDGASDYENMSITLGSTLYGVTVEENTNAYATFGNGGNFVDGYMIEKIETKDGEVIYQHESKPVEVFSPQTSYLTIDMMRDVLTTGTGTAARSALNNPSVDWAGKTGTSNDWRDTWFVATNPNVTLGSWMGYDYNQTLDQGYSTRNNVYWAQLVNAATEIRPELLAPSQPFQQPGGIVSRSYCATSGLLPSEECSQLGLVRSDIYNANFVPTKQDYSLLRDNYVMVGDNALLAGENTPAEFTEGDGYIFNPEWLSDMGYDRLSNIRQLIPFNASGGWLKIQFSNSNNSAMNNDGADPTPPGGVNISNQTLNWSKSGSPDVVGYRIYRASNPEDGNFQRIGSTAELSFTVPNQNAVYIVKSVDYYGNESAASNKVIVGDFSDEDEETNEEDSDETSSPENEDQINQDNGSNGNNSNGENNNSNNGNNGNTNDQENTNNDTDQEPEEESETEKKPDNNSDGNDS